MDDLSSIIKYHRKKAGLSQKFLADLAGIGKTVVFDIEKGKETVQFKSILSVMKVLNIQITYISPLMANYLSENENSKS
jgi:HTH-type transcriptional regulator / antitoxin HipB